MVVEKIKKQGHCAIRLPLYPADMNVMELLCGYTSGYVAGNNLTLKLKDIKEPKEV